MAVIAMDVVKSETNVGMAVISASSSWASLRARRFRASRARGRNSASWV